MVDLELSLVIDVSGSVDSTDYTLQLEGYARAFENPLIHAAIASGSEGQIAVNLVQFSITAAESIGWTLINDAASWNAFGTAVRAATRLFDADTNIDAGINAAYPLFTGNGYDGPRQVIDVSGDGSGGGVVHGPPVVERPRAVIFLEVEGLRRNLPAHTEGRIHLPTEH
jgi:hypothetical protein